MSALPSDHFQRVSTDGVVTHVLVPVDEFNRLRLAAEAGGPASGPSDSEIDNALRILRDPATEWTDAEDVLLQIARDGLSALRKDRGMTQAELAAELGLSQAQVSRIERRPENASLRLLREIAEILRRQG